MTKLMQLITGSGFYSWDVSYANSIYTFRKIRPQKILLEILTNLTCVSFSLSSMLTHWVQQRHWVRDADFSSHQNLLLSLGCIIVINAALKLPSSWMCLNIFFCCSKTSAGFPKHKFKTGLLALFCGSKNARSGNIPLCFPKCSPRMLLLWSEYQKVWKIDEKCIDWEDNTMAEEKSDISY